MATDRYRVAAKELAWQGDSVGDDGLHALIPARTLAEIGKTFSHTKNLTITLSVGGDRELVAFSSDRRTVTTLLIKGSFLLCKAVSGESFGLCGREHPRPIEATRRVALVWSGRRHCDIPLVATGSR